MLTHSQTKDIRLTFSCRKQLMIAEQSLEISIRGLALEHLLRQVIYIVYSMKKDIPYCIMKGF